MKLREFCLLTRRFEAALRRPRRRRRHRGQPHGQARRCCSSPLPAARPTACASSRRRSPPALSAIVAERPPQAPLPAGVAFVRVDNARRALALWRPNSSPRQPQHHRGRHRHQRQDLGRRLHAADLDRARPPRREHRHGRRRLAARRDLRLADDARPGRAAPLARPARRRRRHPSRDRSVLARPRSAPARRRADRRRRLSPISPAIISIIIRASRPISPPSCGCSRILLEPGGAAVIDVDHEHARGGRRRRARRAAFRSSASGAQGTGIRLVECRDRRICADAAARAWRQRFSGAFAAGRRVPGRERAGRRRPRHRDRQRCRPRCSRRSSASSGAKGRLELVGASSAARRSSSTMRTSPTRSPRRSRRCGPT